MALEVTYRRLKPKVYQAVVIDESRSRWVWSKPILERSAEYQGPMSMLGGTHRMTAYDIEGYGTVPGTLGGTETSDYIEERFTEHPEEFLPYYVLGSK